MTHDQSYFGAFDFFRLLEERDFDPPMMGAATAAYTGYITVTLGPVAATAWLIHVMLFRPQL